MWGAIIDPLCERYGWTMEYVVWGISFVNIRMLLGDMVSILSDYKGEKVYNADDPEQLQQFLREMGE